MISGMVLGMLIGSWVMRHFLFLAATSVATSAHTMSPILVVDIFFVKGDVYRLPSFSVLFGEIYL